MKAKVVESQRRKFLAGMVAAGSAAAVVALAPGEESAAQSAEVQSPLREPASQGYQRTAHVEAYYRTLRE
jgi:secreted PhoX family phosphatase